MMERRKNLNDKFGFAVVMKYNLLKDIAEINMGQSPDSLSYNNVKRGLPFYQGNADFGELYPIAKTWCDAPKKTAKKNDILISVRAPIGAINYTSELCCIGRGLAAITVEDDIDRNYIYYFLKAINSELINQGTGSTFKAIGRPVLEMLKVPAISEKQKILIIKSMDFLVDIIKLRKKELILLDELIKARFVEMFGNPVLNDKEWKQEPLRKLATKIGSGATPKGGKDTYRKEGISFIRSMNVHNGQFEYKDLAHISYEQATQLDNVTIEPNDVLLNITGASVARCCIVPADILPARVNQHVCIVRCNDSIMAKFLNYLLIDNNCQDLLWNIAGSGATREAITKQQIENLPIILPPFELQQQFEGFVEQVDKSREEVKKSLEKTQQLYDSLMQEYFG